jgi:replicative DNA helicase
MPASEAGRIFMNSIKNKESFADKLDMIRKGEAFAESPMTFGKLPPQAVHLEEAILGAIIIEKYALSEVTNILSPDMFYRGEHKTIYKAILDIESRSTPLDQLTLAECLRKDGTLEEVGGAYYIAEITSRIGSSANIQYHARMVCEKWMLREFIKLSAENTRVAYENADPFDLINDQVTKLGKVLNLIGINETVHISECAMELSEHTDMVMSAKGDTGIPSGFTKLDLLTGGWQNTDLIILAGRPGDGKTALALALLKNAGCEALIYSLEMSRLQLMQRLSAMLSGVGLYKIRHGKMDQADLGNYNNALGVIEKSPIWINDKGGNYIDNICQDIKRHVRQKGIKIVLIDYLQLINYHNAKNSTKNDEIGEITKRLKALAKELNIPIILLSQLSREIERAMVYKPKLSYLRDSGHIEQDADIVMFVHRPNKNDQEQDEFSSEGEIHLLKHRNGDLGKIDIEFDADIVLFKNNTVERISREPDF